MAKVIGYGHGLSAWGWIKYGIASIIALPFLVIGFLCVGAYIVVEFTIRGLDWLFTQLDWWVKG